MRSTATAVKGSAKYVAIEKFNGKLHGRAGSFVLQHSDIITHGKPQLTIRMVPDSGSGQLTGLAGMVRIFTSSSTHSPYPPRLLPTEVAVER